MIPPPPTTHLLYLHGFRSSPQSAKAQQLAAWVALRAPTLVWCCPQLPPSPSAAWGLINGLTTDWPSASMAVVGSSLGSFYATALAEQRACRAVVLNPAVDPARDLAAYVGEQQPWHDTGAAFDFKPEYLAELTALRRHGLAQPQNYYAVIAKGDEVLDWREMLARYQGAKVQLLEGSDHGLSEFSLHIAAVMSFLGLCT